MLALENSTDEEVYKALNTFNKLVMQYKYPVFTAPSETAARDFHNDLLAWFEDIKREVEANPTWGMPMSELDAVQHAMLQGSTKWKVAWVKAFGQPVANPFNTLTEVVSHHPEVFNVMISRLEPGAELPPHTGPFRGVIRYHLGLEVPEGDVGLEVAGHKYQWKAGVGITFDDTLMHRAWNHINQDRVVIFADVLRPLGPLVTAKRDNLIKLLTKSQGLDKIIGSIQRRVGRVA
jgi:hypothetical protein